MSKRLHSLIKEIDLEVPAGLPNPLIENITCDSRLAKQGSLFLGLPGEKVNGGYFWKDAFTSGASAAVIGLSAARSNPPGINDAVMVFPEPVSKWAGELLSAFWDTPSSRIDLIGVTGTNGKTTTTYLIDFLIKKLGRQSALFGTLINSWPNHQEKSILTTGHAEGLQEKLAKAVDAGTEIAAMEVSSHALAQNRVAGCHFSGAVFTNLTQDHLDYHESMQKYFEVKSLLFRRPLFQSFDSARAVVNIDDEWGSKLAKDLKHNCWKCSLDNPINGYEDLELYVKNIEISAQGVRGLLHTPLGEGYFHSPLIGRFNLMNLLQAVGVLVQQGLPLQEMLEALADFPGVPGRMERINLVDNNVHLPTVLVDYAHTPDGLKNALIAARSFTRGKLICVFGCGGDRDRGKRAKMGAVAAEYADIICITSDNPRTEHPQAIINDIFFGLPNDYDALVETDRAKAIDLAIALANSRDLVLIAGKGHEDYQILGTQKIYFDDRVCARKVLSGKLKM
tara:strand:+ start:19688 stop:21211 length:1524 start_codon:yes stop_codon:yes gene_type:complete